ncbi:Fe(3+)-hydroxamate ABC transporter permease FhuB [Georhizobium profundi]|uniref:Fe(3+)-hydroxamate ABC transporter permease FhuB n=1 Tax=Georhizobium profundi TaxID=2341112 RepID=A0A3S9B6U7_9HYPH|nr:Fe(3+)-hydroxamate ABC transporter permease FhuB [Georhizobium profundi]AZN72637.1 Fe(3+)-hydroxamate ABC transporter permease FhuB [Georhizobium profundi]
MRSDPSISRTGFVLLGAGTVLVAAFVLLNLDRLLPTTGLSGLFGGEALPLTDGLILNYAYWPRLLTALLAGAALGLAGVIFQQVLQNPLAASETLGVSAGAHLALTLGLLLAPTLQSVHPEFFAVAGAFSAWGLIALIARRYRGDPLTLILTGFVVSFALGAVSSLLMLLNQEYLTSLFIWGAGSLAQDDWSSVGFLVPRLAACILIVALLSRALLLLGFGDDAARGLGVSLKFARPLLLGVAVFLSASVVASVGVIAFISLAAPHLARLAGAERLSSRLIGAPIAGALLVLVIDQAIQLATPGQSALLPTGAVTALIGAPIMIWLLSRLPAIALEGSGRVASVTSAVSARPMQALMVAALVLVAVLGAALLVGRGPEGLTFGFDVGAGAMEWRLPRVIAAAAAGLGIGVAGTLVQRLFANQMASPEILGVGGGVAVGLIVSLLLSSTAGVGLQLLGAIGGALTVMALLMVLGGRRGFQAERLLLIGIAVTALLDGVVLLFLALGDPRSSQVLAWMGGSTYRATMELALAVAVISIASLVAVLPFSRWLDILPLGDEAARGLGLPIRAVRFTILIVSAIVTGAAALVIGPMSFVGLLAPHVANLAGLRRGRHQVIAAALIGSALVAFSDWVGRIIFAPTELPAGILAVFIGASTVAVFLFRR